MKAGRLRHRITLERATESNDMGQITKSWSSVGSYWAGIEPLNGRELVTAQSVKPDVTTRIVLRYVGSITSKDRFTFNSRVFHILNVRNIDERNAEYEILCKEII